MTTKLTDRDKKLLFWLGIVGIIAAFWYFGIRPLTNLISVTNTYIDSATEEKALDQERFAALPVLKATNETMQSNITATESDYYDMMASDQVDRLLTNLVLSEGLSSRNLVITMPTETVTLQPYKYSAAAQTATESGGTAGNTTGTTSSSAATTNAVTANTAAGAAAVSGSAGSASSSADSTASGTASSGVYAVEASMEVSGDMATCQKLIDDLTTDFPGIRVTSFEWGDGPLATTDANGNLISANPNLRVLTLGLELYMCEK